MRKWLQMAISIALMGYLLYFLYENRGVFLNTFAGTALHGAALFACILATWVINSLQTLLPLRELGVRIGFWENLFLNFSVYFGNYLPMRAGTLLRMKYVKSFHGVGYLVYGGVLGTRGLLLLWAAGATGLVGAAGQAAFGHTVGFEGPLLFGAILLAGALPFLLPIHALLPTRGLAGRVASELTGAIALIRRNRRITALYLGLVLVQFVLLSVRMAVAFDAVGRQPGVWVYFFIGPVTTIVSFINITPGNLALREWVVGVASAALGVGYADGIFASTVDRAVQMGMILTIGGAAFAWAVARLGRHHAATPGKARG